MKKRFYRLLSIILCICIGVGIFAGCSRNKKLIDFIYPFGADITSLDPQLAASSDEFLIIENTFEGLVRVNDDGTVIPGCAEKWEVSPDGLTYTFTLQQGLKWNIDTERYEEGDSKGEFKDKRLQMLGYEFNPDITAYDFVFALRRAVAPETAAPMFASVSAIQNAVAIHTGKKAADALGVKATDATHLVITLASPDSAFLQTLSTAIAMPCNAEFFEATGGRYGLEPQYTLYNGQFYLKQILESSYLLKKNDYYAGPSPAVADELTLKIPDESSDTVALLKKGYYDAAFISGSESSKLADAEGIQYVPYEDTTWAILLNTNNEVFQSRTMRRAFCLGLSPYDRKDKAYLRRAETLLPSSCRIGEESAATRIGSTVEKQNIDESKALWNKGLKVIDAEEITVTVLTPEGMQNETKALIQGIQSGIGSIVKNSEGDPVSFTLKVEALSDAELASRVASGEYDAALYAFHSTSLSAEAYLDSFAKSTKTGFDTAELEQALAQAEKAATVKAEVRAVRNAEKAIIDTYSIYPVMNETSYYASASGVSGIQFHAGSGRVSFVHTTRKE